MVFPGFESILLPEDNGKQNPDESCKNKTFCFQLWL